MFKVDLPEDPGPTWKEEKAADYAALEQRVKELEAELKDEKEWSARLLETREQFSRELGQCHQARKADQARLTEQADEFGRQIQSLHLDVAARDGENERLRELYSELLNQVGNKYPNETRHATALRYIQNAEKVTDNQTDKALGGGE